uniref:Putative ovule protein n=1 Tax=Solanum chacoense TaxID=4108 RepID=A0A0V0HDY1_SOLCH
MDPGCSDHSPLTIRLADEPQRPPRPFRFYNCLADHYDFNKIVDVAWQEHTTADTILGRTWQKVQHVRRGFKQLDTGEYKKVGAKVKCLRELLTQIQAQMRDHNQYSVLAEHEREIRRQLEKWLNVEESIMSQKSRIQWLALGDSNTAFFHASLKCSYAQNSIHKLINGHGDLCIDPMTLKLKIFISTKICNSYLQ